MYNYVRDINRVILAFYLQKELIRSLLSQTHFTMTLDILSFIDTKGGNSAEIKESQKKRGLSVELVDEIIQMYADWVKSKFLSRRVVFSLIYVCVLF